EAPSRQDRATADAVAALTSLGYPRAQAEKAVEGAVKKLGAAPDLEAVLRLALGTLSGAKAG
ncbi:MAG TPA: RuvA C-terminal domain-containing protein, partial [Candidatus Methylomirabilis sp.]